MDTSTSKTAEVAVARTTAEKIAILRGTQRVYHKDVTVEDWAELIDQVIKDYKPYFKYVHSFTTVKARVEGVRPDARVRVELIPDSTRITPVYRWQRDDTELQLFIDCNGCLAIESLTCVRDSTVEVYRMCYHYELCCVLSTVEFLKHQSRHGKFTGSALGEDIVGGLFQVFDRSIKHRAKMLQNLEIARDHLQGLLSRVAY